MNEYCKVVYLDRTEGISSSEIRSEQSSISLGLVGNSGFLNKVVRECAYVNGIHVVGICADDMSQMSDEITNLPIVTDNYFDLLDKVDAVFIHSYPAVHYAQIKQALEIGKHVLCESPIALKTSECRELFDIAKKNNLVLIEALRTAYSTAYSRLLLLVKGGKIGEVVSVDSTCTSLREIKGDMNKSWNSITAWGPTAMLPIFQLLGTNYVDYQIISQYFDRNKKYDIFSKINFVFSDAVASVKVGTGAKSEGELIISGTKGYVYVPAPWWKTDYFEIRYENPADNKRYFYQLDGEGIRNEMVAFVRSINKSRISQNIDNEISEAFVQVLENFAEGNNSIEICKKTQV